MEVLADVFMAWTSPGLSGQRCSVEPRSLRRAVFCPMHTQTHSPVQGLRCLPAPGWAHLSSRESPASASGPQSQAAAPPRKKLERWRGTGCCPREAPGLCRGCLWLPFDMLRPPGPLGQGTDSPECPRRQHLRKTVANSPGLISWAQENVLEAQLPWSE